MERHGRTAERRQESVWDFPLPPRPERTDLRAQVIQYGFVIADSVETLRVLQRGIAPTYYFPPEDVERVYLVPSGHTTECPFKGMADYFDVVVGDSAVPDAAWTYADPLPPFAAIAGCLSFYPALLDACLLDGEPARRERDDTTGGWITPGVLGLSKGYPRTWDRIEDA